MKQPLYRTATPRQGLLTAIVALTAAVLFLACSEPAEDEGYCPEPQELSVEQGRYNSTNEMDGEEYVAPPHANGQTKEKIGNRVDDEVIITYTKDDGTVVEETWRITRERRPE